MRRTLLNNTRKERGISARQMAEQLGISRRYYLEIESGSKTGRTDIWDGIEDILGVNQRILREKA